MRRLRCWRVGRHYRRWARRNRRVPYVWGGVGPGGYDCSGFQSAVLKAALGRRDDQSG